MSASAGESGSRGALADVLEALDGSERKLLLEVLADGWPDVVEAGLQRLAEWHADCRERYRATRRQKARERRRASRGRA